ncbi:hypothetical protein R3I94_008978 [Phoxinus phoxinus]
METGITSLPGFMKSSSAQRTDLLILLQQDGKAGMNTNHPLRRTQTTQNDDQMRIWEKGTVGAVECK